MIQIKLYQYNHNIIKKDLLITSFPDNLLYFFSNLSNVVGVGFDFDKNSLRIVNEKATHIGLRPIILTGPKFIRLIESAIISGKKIADVEFTFDINYDDREELESLLSMKKSSSSLLVFIKQILKTLNTSIKNITWYEGSEHPVRLSLYDSGILYVNDDVETLKKADFILSSAVSR